MTSTDGTIRRYGASDNSRIYAVGTTGDVARWLLDEIQDTYGNTISISYQRDPVNEPGTAYVSGISYAGGQRNVDLVYETRPDVIRDYAGGVERVPLCQQR